MAGRLKLPDLSCVMVGLDPRMTTGTGLDLLVISNAKGPPEGGPHEVWSGTDPGLATRRKVGSERGLPRFRHHFSHARGQSQNLTRHRITFLSER